MTDEIKKIQISNGEYALVDKADFGMLSKFTWSIARGYAMRFDSDRKSVYLHKEILSADKKKTDHINGNKLDNRRINLRLATHQQNSFNQKTKKGSSIYRGVCWDKQYNKWRARISINYKGFLIGLFDSERHAAMAYDIAARDLYGKFSKLNFNDHN